MLNTPEAAEIKDHEIDRCLSFKSDEVEIIMTHDSPSGIGVPHSTRWDIHGPMGFARGRELLDHFAPRLWFFYSDRMVENPVTTRRERKTTYPGGILNWEGAVVLSRLTQEKLKEMEFHSRPNRSCSQTREGD